jgi:ubiquinone/menaquinone biosynthesis C-methylase UbiE
MKSHAQPHRRISDRISNITSLLCPLEYNFKTYLDIGCGNAEVTHAISQTYKIQEVFGADTYHSDQYVPPHSHSNIRYYQVCDNFIPLDDSSVDLITCFMSIHHFNDFERMLFEIKRVIRPGGSLFIREHDVHRHNIKLKAALDRIHTKYHDFNGDSLHYWDRYDLQYELCRSGFQFVGSLDYPDHIPNDQAIYHSLYSYILVPPDSVSPPALP